MIRNVALFILSERELRDVSLSSLVSETPETVSLEIFTHDHQLIERIETGLNQEVKIISPFSLMAERVSYFFSLCRIWRFRLSTVSHKIRASALLGSKEISHKNRAAQNGAETRLPRIFTLIIRLFSHYPFYFFVRLLFHLVSFLEGLKLKEIPPIAIVAYLGELSGRFELIVQALKYRGVTVVAFQSNWDNLSSKNIVYVEPHYFGVWGEQSKMHLEAMQGVSNVKIRVIGSPRFSNHFELRNKKRIEIDRQISNQKKIVFASAGSDFETDLVILKKLISLPRNQYKLYYKAHPFARSRLNVNEYSFLFGESDNLIEVIDDDYNNFLDLLSEANTLVAQLSTLCLESLILKTPVVMPLFSAKKQHYIGYDKAYHYLTHFNGMQAINEVFPVYNLSDLCKVIQEVTAAQFPFNARLDWFCTPERFSDNLWDLVLKV